MEFDWEKNITFFNGGCSIATLDWGNFNYLPVVYCFSHALSSFQTSTTTTTTTTTTSLCTSFSQGISPLLHESPSLSPVAKSRDSRAKDFFCLI